MKTSTIVRKLYANGFRQCEIADMLGLSRQTVSATIKYQPRKNHGKVQKWLAEQPTDIWIPLEFSPTSVFMAAKSLGLEVTTRKGRLMVITT